MKLIEANRYGRSSVELTYDRLRIRANRLREDKEGLVGEVEIYIRLPLTLVLRAKLNFLSQTAKRNLVKMLKERYQLSPEEDWYDIVEDFSDLIIAKYREPEPIIVIGEKPSNWDVWLVEPFIAKNTVNILYGPGGSMKSYFGLLLSLMAKEKIPFNSFCSYSADPINPLFLDYEDFPEVANTRLIQLAQGLQVETPTILYRKCFLPLRYESETIGEQIRKNKANLVIIDSLAPACLGYDLFSAQAAVDTFSIFREWQVSVLAIAHLSKGDIKEGKNASPYGTVFFQNLSRCVWELKAELHDKYTDLHFIPRKMNYAKRFPEPRALRIYEDFTIVPVEKDTEDFPLAYRITQFLKNENKALLPSEIAEELSVSEQAVRASLGRGNFVHLKDGRWGIKSRKEEEDEIPV